MATERLRVILEMVTADYKKGAKDAARATDGITKSGKAAGKSVGGLSSRVDDFGKNARRAFAGGVILAGLNDLSKAATDLGESTNAVQKIFGDSADIITDFGKVSASAVGLATSEFQTLATQTGALLGNFGFDARSAATETVKLTSRAADLASVFNTDVGTALDAVNAALRGETEPIRRFGISLSDATVRAKAVELGLADTTSAVDANGKAVAALELIYEQSSAAQGDFIQTSDDAANAQRRLQAQVENSKAAFGQTLLPLKAFAFEFGNAAVLAGRAIFGDEAADQAFRFEEAIERIRRAFEDGTNPTIAFQEALAEMTRNADLTSGELQTLITFAGLAGMPLEQLRDVVLENADAMSDLTDEELAEMKAAFDGLIGPADGAGAAVGNLADETNDAALASKRLADETVNTASVLKAQADPLFKAIRAYQNLVDVQEDIAEGGVTLEEQITELAPAFLESKEAIEELGDGNLERGIEVIAAAVGVAADDVRAFVRELGLLDQIGSIDLAIRVSAERASSGILDPSIAAAARRAGIDRAHGGPVSAGRSYMVGERGPEFFTPTSSGRISSGPLGDAGGGVTINLNVTTQPGFSNQVVREMEQALARYRAGVS